MEGTRDVLGTPPVSSEGARNGFEGSRSVLEEYPQCLEGNCKVFREHSQSV